MKFTIDYANELNEHQYEVATSLIGPYLVIAGAGSGKTRIIAYRVARMIEEGIKPRNILLITFTKKAATELIERPVSMLGEHCMEINGGTFHGFALKILKQYQIYTGYKDFTIMDPDDASEAISYICGQLNVSENKIGFPKKGQIKLMIGKARSRKESIGNLIKNEYVQYELYADALIEIDRRYQAFKQKSNMMDFDDLQINLVRLLKENKSVRNRIHDQYKYIMVDEYQDTDRVQAEIAYLLACDHRNIMVVGDDAQSIYAFRGAYYRNTEDFVRMFPEARSIKLEQNYRSEQRILDVSNTIINSSSETIRKTLYSTIKGNEKPKLVMALDSQDQSMFIIETIQELREKGIKLNEIAILFRNGNDSSGLELMLNGMGIPFKKFGGMAFAEKKHIRDLIAHIKIGLNIKDSLSWNRVLKKLPGIGDTTAAKIIQQIVDEERGLDYLIDEYLQSRPFGPRLKRLYELLVTIYSERDLTERILQNTITYYKPIFEHEFSEQKKRWKDIETLQTISKEYQHIGMFLDMFTLESLDVHQEDEENETRPKEYLTLSTIHSAKGLEWHTVFLIGVNDGGIPSARALNSEGGEEEERRILYVALTRAKMRLYLINIYYTTQPYIKSRVSRFIEPLIEENSEQFLDIIITCEAKQRFFQYRAINTFDMKDSSAWA